MRRSFSTISEKTEVTYCSPFQKWCSVFPHSYLSVENLITLAYLQAVFEVYMDFSNSYLLYNLALLCINELIAFACAGYGQVLWNSAGFKWQSYIEVCALQEWIVLLWWRPEDNVCLYVILLGNITPRPNKTTSAIKQTWPEGTRFHEASISPQYCFEFNLYWWEWPSDDSLSSPNEEEKGGRHHVCE